MPPDSLPLLSLEECLSGLKLGPRLTQQLMQSLRELPSIAAKKGITQEDLHALYALAFDLYQTECFRQSAAVFRLLCFFQPQSAKNWIGLGGASQHIKNHQSALAAFAMASFYEPLNPEPRLYAAHSLIDLGNLPMALVSAEAAVELSTNNNDKQSVAQKATALCHALSTTLPQSTNSSGSSF